MRVTWGYSGTQPANFIVYCNNVGTLQVGGSARSATVNCGTSGGSYVQVGVKAVKGSQDSGISYGEVR